MSFRREIFATIGGFRVGMGRIGKRPVGCEETELCIRAKQQWPMRTILYNPAAQVFHRVPAERSCWRYFRQRCFAEGISKAQVTQHVGSNDGLASERAYLLQALPMGIGTGIADSLRGQRAGILRAVAIIFGLCLTTLGYLIGKAQQRSNQFGPSSAQTSVVEPSAPNFTPALVLQVELSQALPAVTAIEPTSQRRYQRALTLVRLHSKPLGVVEIPLKPNGLGAEEYARHIWYALGPAINQHLEQDGLPTIHALTATGLPQANEPACQHECSVHTAQAPKVSVVIATRNRTASLAITLDSLLASTYRNFEIIVVDNAPSDNATADLIQQKYSQHPQVRYVREDRPGLAVAHNRGLQKINAPLVAFTDDDVIVDRHWLAEIVKNLQSDPQIGCVTGMIAPAEIETPAQGWIEQFGFSKGFTRRIFDLHSHRPNNPLHPYAAGTFGSGANMAFRASALYAIGGFDPALGAGSTALGGDDLESFFQIIVKGYKLVYEPAALVHHWHRRDYAGLRRQAYGYGVGLTAYLTKTLVDNPLRVFDFVRKAPYGLRFALKLRSANHLPKQSDYPSELTRLERRGMLYGPIAYLRSRSRLRLHDKNLFFTPDQLHVT
jgi:GT2 family glycosyltransferase